jgi:hypothetical protein
MAQDVTNYNYEVAYSRGLPAGEYVANVHMYRGIGVTYPVTVKLVARVADAAGFRPGTSHRHRAACGTRTIRSRPSASSSMGMAG